MFVLGNEKYLKHIKSKYCLTVDNVDNVDNVAYK